MKTTPLLVLLAVWLLFFPNAPYIITDFFHLKPRLDEAPLWFDTALLFSFAWNGLLLGFLSLVYVQKAVSARLSWAWGWMFSIAALGLGSYGIYIGRYLRWNSWDIVADPLALFRDAILHLSSSRAIGITLLFTVFLTLGYATLRQLMLSPALRD